MTVDTPGQAILDRTAVVLTPDALEARFTIALPASGRTVLGQMAYGSIIDMLPQYVQQVRITLRVNADDAAADVADAAADADSFRLTILSQCLILIQITKMRVLMRVLMQTKMSCT